MHASASPRELNSLFRLLATNVVAAGMLVAGWWFLSGEPRLANQLPWLNLSVAGLLVALWGNARWLLEGRRRVGMVLHSLLPEATSQVNGTAPIAAGAERGLVAGPDLVRFHRSDCPMARDRDWPLVIRDRAVDEGRLPCGVCAP